MSDKKNHTELNYGKPALDRERMKVRRGILNSLGKAMRSHHALACAAAYMGSPSREVLGCYAEIPEEEINHDQEAV